MRQAIIALTVCTLLVVLVTSAGSNPASLERPPTPVEVVNDSSAPLPVEVYSAPDAPVSVDISNGPDAPVPMQSVPGPEPFQFWNSYDWDEADGFFAVPEVLVVPPGKILVIEFITMNFTIGYDENLVRPTIEIGLPFQGIRHIIKCDRMTPDGKVAYLDNPPFFGHWTATEMVKIYAKGNIAFHARRENSPFVDGAVNLSISGYLIDE
ncbi:MAG: hypothetical protein RL885_27930 [Planctomycetota bacterium]